MPECGSEHHGWGRAGGLPSLLPTGVRCTPGSVGHIELGLIMKPLRWQIILFEFSSANYTSSALSAFVFVTLRS